MKVTTIEMRGLLTGKCVPRDMKVNEDLANYFVRKFEDHAEEVARLNEQVRALAEFKDKVRQSFHMGDAAEDFAIFINIENTLRRSACLSAVEREFFTREAPDEDYPDEMGEECNLSWGKAPSAYVADFAAELREVGARSVDGAAMGFHEKAFVAFENSNETGPFIRADLQQYADRIRAGEQP